MSRIRATCANSMRVRLRGFQVVAIRQRQLLACSTLAYIFGLRGEGSHWMELGDSQAWVQIYCSARDSAMSVEFDVFHAIASKEWGGRDIRVARELSVTECRVIGSHFARNPSEFINYYIIYVYTWLNLIAMN